MREKERNTYYYLKCISAGAVATIVVAAFLFLFGNNFTVAAELMFYETVPFYSTSEAVAEIFKFETANDQKVFAFADTHEQNVTSAVTKEPQSDSVINVRIFTDNANEANEAANVADGTINVEKIFRDYNAGDVVGINDISFKESDHGSSVAADGKLNLTKDDIAKLHDLDYLRSNFYIVDPTTEMTEDVFDIDYFLNADLHIDTSDGLPKVLIVHTHSYEAYVDSDPGNLYDGVVGVGEKLAELLYDKYGIISVHNTTRYDIVDGKPAIMGAYERLEPDVAQLLKKYPSIEIVIDIHRDGIADETVKLVTDINGKPTAKIMFFNGLSMLKENGKVSNITYLPNDNLKDNLAMSFNMQLKANELYPNLTRKVYLKAYRYSLFQKPKSMLVEVGAQTNTKEEAFNAMEPLADILASVVLGGEQQ